tara:strand:- start:295 stop:438 length:144 start_codon:yes stop_codon:yes gene_type:complete
LNSLTVNESNCYEDFFTFDVIILINTQNNNNILVIGGAGYIGSHIVE